MEGTGRGDLVEGERLFTNSLLIEIDDRIELWVKPLDLENMLFGEFDRRELAGGDHGQQLDGGFQDYVAHGFSSIGFAAGAGRHARFH